MQAWIFTLWAWGFMKTSEQGRDVRAAGTGEMNMAAPALREQVFRPSTKIHHFPPETRLGESHRAT